MLPTDQGKSGGGTLSSPGNRTSNVSGRELARLEITVP